MAGPPARAKSMGHNPAVNRTLCDEAAQRLLLRTLGVSIGGFMKYQRGFLDWALLEIAKNARWYIRYPIAVFLLFAVWWLYEQNLQLFHDHPLLTLPWILIWVGCAAALAKEVSPTLLLMLGSVWIWPTDFFDIPFAQMTFGILSQFILSCLIFVSSLITGLRAYISRQSSASNADANT